MSWEGNGSGGGGGAWGESGGAPLEASFNEPAAGGYGGDSYGGGMGGGGMGGCYNCGQEGHNKAECPNPAVAREFTGTCRACEQQGHRASDCPNKPPPKCRNCDQEGHTAVECENPRKIDRSHIEDMPAEKAWDELVAAVKDHDMDNVKAAAEKYIKATPDTTYQQLERGFRAQDLSVYLIALEKDLAPTYTNMDIQGNLNRQYSVTWRWSSKPMRPREKEGWPEAAENFERLGNAGEPVDRGIPKCSNCDQMGHIMKNCPEEKQENVDRAVVKCYNCEEIGHRVRDCPNPRPDKFACRNCKQSGHSSKECPEPRSAEGVECKKCSEIGHFSRDCPQGGGGSGGACHNCGEEGHRKQDCTNERKLICRNCDGVGHTGKECPKPRDYSRVKCSNCQQMGHTKVRCKEPIVEEGAEGGYNAGGYGGGDGYAVDAPSTSAGA